MRRRAVIIAVPALFWLPSVQANRTAVHPPPELRLESPAARLQGSGDLRFLGMKVYDIRLWIGDKPVVGADWAALPIALEIEYARHLVGHRMAERSLEEMRRQAEIDDPKARRWLAAMKAIFPDVQDGDRLTGVQRPGEGVRFFFNGKRQGEIDDAEFARLFFGIWLSPRCSEPALRSALLGGTQ